MSWQYLTAPSDGQLWLEWLPLEKTEHPYPSDGYAWGDMEHVVRHDYGGYQIEMRVHSLGYRPGHDQMSQRARTRYHFVAKNPSINAPPPDPSLWLVHYHQADHSRWMPTSQFPVTPHLQQTVAQRRWLEGLGRIERREFMLHDREHWPQVHLPGGSQMQQQQGQYNNTLTAMQMNQNRFAQSHYPQQAGNPREAKKPRLEGPPARAIPGSSDGAPDLSIETEEDTALGDFFDHLTQRDISMVRYTQHHQWMEQVFSSPYASHQIVPADLGLGLMGELKGLTDGILDPPDMSFAESAGDKPAKPQEVQPFTNIRKEKVDEFSKRVEKHLEEGRAEIERMKAEHTAKMQDWKKVKALTQAEKRLGNATWEGHEDAVPTFRLGAPVTNGQSEDSAAGKDNVEDVVKEVESMLKVKIASHDETNRIARGGLQDRKQPAVEPPPSEPQDTAMEGMTNSGQQQQAQDYGATTNGATGEPTTYHEDPMASTQTAMPPQPQPPIVQNQQPNSQPQPQSAPATGEILGDMPELDMSDDALMQDMVMGDFDDTTNLDGLGGNNGAAPSQPMTTDANPPTTTAPPALDASSAAPQSSTAQSAPQQDQPAVTQAANPAESGMTIGGETGDTMFNDTFGDLANLEDGDGLIDFGDGMDDAFGDALHGMDG